MRPTIFGRMKCGIALIPIFDTIQIRMGISTRVGNIVANKGDGSSDFVYGTSKNEDYTLLTAYPSSFLNLTYGSLFTGNLSLKVLKGLKDVYSLYLGDTTRNTGSNDNYNSKLNILNLETFFAQFTNLYSLHINEYSYQNTARMPVYKGDFGKLPDSVEKVLISGLEVIGADDGSLFLNLSNYSNSSRLKYFKWIGSPYNYNIKLIGDLANLPPDCNNFYIGEAYSTSAITYTSGKVWASSFDTLYLPIALKPSEIDNLFIDADNSIITAIGDKNFTIIGGIRTQASDSKVSSLISKGFSVNCRRMTNYLNLPLSSDLLDTSGNSNDATIVGTETHDLSALKTSTGNYAYIPNKTSLDFGTGSIEFGCTVKFDTYGGGAYRGIIGKNNALDVKGMYGIYIDASNIYIYNFLNKGLVINTISKSTYVDGNFHKLKCMCDRAFGIQKLYIDDVLINTTTFPPEAVSISINARFMIGGYGNTTGTGLESGTEFNGWIKDVYVNKF